MCLLLPLIRKHIDTIPNKQSPLNKYSDLIEQYLVFYISGLGNLEKDTGERRNEENSKYKNTIKYFSLIK